MRVDPATGRVLSHAEPGKPSPPEPPDLSDLVRRARSSPSKAADKFAAALDAERRQRAGLEEKFRKAQEKARDNPDEAPPNPFDDRWR